MIVAEIEAVRRLIQTMDEHLDFLGRMPAPEIPSDNQAMFYVSNTEGFIQIQQDSTFIAEWLLVRVPFDVQQNAQEKVGARDTGPGMVLTLGQQRMPNDIGAAPTNPVVLVDSVRIPWCALVPLSTNTAIGNTGRTNADYAYRLPAEWQLARGTSVRVEFEAFNTAIAVGIWGPVFGIPRMGLFGRKVFG